MMTCLIVEVANVSTRNKFAFLCFRQFGRTFMKVRPPTVSLEKLAVCIQVQTVSACYSFLLRDTKFFNGRGDFMNHSCIKKLIKWVELGRNAITPFSFRHEKFQRTSCF